MRGFVPKYLNFNAIQGMYYNPDDKNNELNDATDNDIKLLLKVNLLYAYVHI